jgi:ATP-dependent Clp protease adaptor protein ClpS
MSIALPETDISVDELEKLWNMEAFEKPWKIIVLDDDVTPMDYVIAVFMKHFKLSEEDATLKMLEVHNSGRSVLESGKKEDMEFHMVAMHSYKLQATIEQD